MLATTRHPTATSARSCGAPAGASATRALHHRLELFPRHVDLDLVNLIVGKAEALELLDQGVLVVSLVQRDDEALEDVRVGVETLGIRAGKHVGSVLLELLL